MSIFNEVNDLLEAINLISFDEEKTDEEKAVLIQQCLEQIQGTFNEKGENLVKVLKGNVVSLFVVLLIVPYTFYSLYTCYNSTWGQYFHDYITIFSLNRWL